MKRNINNLMFAGFIITDIFELQNLLEDTCTIGGSRLISFDIKDGYVTIRSLDPECNEVRHQIEVSEFNGARINGRNRHGKQVVYVKEAEVLAIKMMVNDQEDIDFEALIDENKINNIGDYIK